MLPTSDPATAPGVAVVNSDDALWRLKAQALQRLPATGMQLLLRELDTTDLLYVLWFTKNQQLGQSVINNLSCRAAAMVLDELIARFYGRNPDTASEQDKTQAHQSLQRVLDILQRLTDEGQIAQVNPCVSTA